MIRTSAIINALGQRLELLDPALPIVWPNRDSTEGLVHPYLVFDPVPVSRRDETLTGGGAIATGFVMITVMSDIGGFSTSAMDIAEDVAALYPYTLRLPVTGGAVTISQPPEVMQGYPDGPHWRTPVRVPYSAS